jgi:hypothetical protein
MWDMQRSRFKYKKPKRDIFEVGPSGYPETEAFRKAMLTYLEGKTPDEIARRAKDREKIRKFDETLESEMIRLAELEGDL